MKMKQTLYKNTIKNKSVWQQSYIQITVLMYHIRIPRQIKQKTNQWANQAITT